MKIPFFTLVAPTLLAAALLMSPAFSKSAQAAAKQYVVVIAEGASPQVLDLGKAYLRKAEDDAELSTSFDALITAGKSANAGTDALTQMQGLLETAEKNGYKTGLVTTGDLSAVAPLFYSLGGDAASALTGADAKYDFLAGGGRAKFGEGAGEKIKAGGGTYIIDEEGLDGEISGRVLAAQADSDLDFALDRDPTVQAGLGELSTLALDTLGAGDAPFVLVIHDTLVKKALDTKDTPALFAQFRELDAILADVTARRDDNANLGLAVLMTGSQNTPLFTTPVEAEQQNALFILSNLALSYAGAGRALKGADNDAIAAFANATDGQYPGLRLSPQTREGITAGTVDSETAVRASYEPALKFGFSGPAAAPVAYALGFDAPDGLVAALQAAVASPAK